MDSLAYIPYYRYRLADKVRISRFGFINRPFRSASEKFVADNLRLQWRFYGFNYGAALFNFFYLVHKGLWAAVVFNLLLTMIIMYPLLALQSAIGLMLPQYAMTLVFALCCGFTANVFLLLKTQANIEKVMQRDNRKRMKKHIPLNLFDVLDKINQKYQGMQFFRLMLSPFYMALIFYCVVLMSHPLLLQQPAQAFDETGQYFKMLVFLVMFG